MYLIYSLNLIQAAIDSQGGNKKIHQDILKGAKPNSLDSAGV